MLVDLKLGWGRYLYLAAGLLTFIAIASATTNSTEEPDVEHYELLSNSGSLLAYSTAISNNDFKKSKEFLSQLHIYKPDNLDIIEQLFSLSLINGDFEEAKQFALLFDDLQKVTDSEIQEHFFLKSFLMLENLKQGKIKKAKTYIAKSNDFIYDEMSYNFTKGWIAYEEDHTLITVDSFNKVKDISILNVYYLIHQALLADLQDRHKDADTYYAEALQVGGMKIDVVDAYGRFLERTGREKQAFALYNDFENRSGENRLISKARERLISGVKPRPYVENSKDAIGYMFYHIADMYKITGHVSKSMKYARLAQFLLSNDEYVVQVLAQNYQIYGKYIDANVELEKIIKSSPFYKNAQINIAQNLNRNGQEDLALATIVKLYDKNKVEDDVYLTYANLLVMDEKYNQAIDIYTSIINSRKLLTVNDADLFFARATTYDAADDWAKAEIDLKKTIELYPNHMQALNYLGYTWIDKGVNLEAGLKMINKALSVNRMNQDIIDSLGWAYYKLGKYKLAKVELERAAKIAPNSADISDHLGDVYWKLDRKLEAKFKWQQATIYKSEFIDYDDLAYKLEHGLDALHKKNSTEKVK